MPEAPPIPQRSFFFVCSSFTCFPVVGMSHQIDPLLNATNSCLPRPRCRIRSFSIDAGMEFFFFNKAHTGADAKVLRCDAHPEIAAIPAFPTATTSGEAATAEPGKAMGSGPARTMTRCADEVTMAKTASLSASPLASATICATEERGFLSALFGGIGSASDFVRVENEVEAAKGKALRRQQTHPQEDVVSAAVETGSSTPTDVARSSTSTSLSCLPAPGVEMEVEEAERKVMMTQKAVEQDRNCVERSNENLLMDNLRTLCIAMGCATERALAPAVDALLEFLATLKTAAFSVAEYMGIVEEKKQEPEGLLEQLMLWWSPPPPKAEPPTFLNQVVDFFTSATAGV